MIVIQFKDEEERFKYINNMIKLHHSLKRGSDWRITSNYIKTALKIGSIMIGVIILLYICSIGVV